MLFRSEDIENRHFWCKEQLGIYEDVYSKMNIRPMRPLDMDNLRSKKEFEVPLAITERMGLHPLMAIQCDYHEYYVQQFYSTLAFRSDPNITMTWLTGEEECEANFHDFARILGYAFPGSDGAGQIVHNLEHPDERVFNDLFEAGQPINLTAGLLPLYGELVKFFRMNIAPSGGNNDAIRASLINLLYFAYEVANDPNPGPHNKLDVMDYIYKEMFDAMVCRTTISYAPYIWMLIKNTALDLSFRTRDLVAHELKKPYVPKNKPFAPIARDSFMADARASSHGRTSAQNLKPTLAKEVKQLNWFQKYLLCMNVDIRKEQHRAHNERLDILHNQDVLIHHVTKHRGNPPVRKRAPSYQEWNNNSEIDWIEIEKQLKGSSAEGPSQPAQEDEEEDGEESESSYDFDAEV